MSSNRTPRNCTRRIIIFMLVGAVCGGIAGIVGDGLVGLTFLVVPSACIGGGLACMLCEPKGAAIGALVGVTPAFIALVVGLWWANANGKEEVGADIGLLILVFLLLALPGGSLGALYCISRSKPC